MVSCFIYVLLFRDEILFFSFFWLQFTTNFITFLVIIPSYWFHKLYDCKV